MAATFAATDNNDPASSQASKILLRYLKFCCASYNFVKYCRSFSLCEILLCFGNCSCALEIFVALLEI